MSLSQEPPVNPPLRDFSEWRSDMPIQFEAEKIQLHFPKDTPPEIAQKVQDRCLAHYYRSYGLMEHSVGEVATRYVYENGDPTSQNDGPILTFAKAFSLKYLDLLEAYVNMEREKSIPMISMNAGQLKQMGFTSKEILEMQIPCQTFTQLSDRVLAYCNGNLILFEKIMGVLSSKESREKDPAANQDPLVKFIKEYNEIPNVEMIDKAHFLMHSFGHMSYTEISKQLYFVGIQRFSKKDREASTQERLLMEIRHRVAIESSNYAYFGSMGSNPLAYLNLVKHGDPLNKEAELRERLFFVYMLNHFANAVIKEDETIKYINEWLNNKHKGWQLDKRFIDAMKSRGKQYIAPVFRYGAAAQLNYALRRYKTDEEMQAYLKQRQPLPTVQSIMSEQRDINSFYNLRLSDRELMSQTGEWTFNVNDRNQAYKRLKFVGGIEMFELIKDPTSIALDNPARKYLEQANALQIPVVTGISGTLDQSTAMAGLVGIGVAQNLETRIQELERIRLAYLAFMVPAHDHSVHEIMSSSQTYGLLYKAGPGYQKFIFPEGGERFIQQLKQAQKDRGLEFPDYYLSPAYIEAEIKRVQNESSLDEKVVQEPRQVFFSSSTSQTATTKSKSTNSTKPTSGPKSKPKSDEPNPPKR